MLINKYYDITTQLEEQSSLMQRLKPTLHFIQSLHAIPILDREKTSKIH